MLIQRFIPRIFILMVLISYPVDMNAQWGSSQNSADTSDYIPYYFENSLQYNLLIAASKGYSSGITGLIAMGADINTATYEGATPLILAVSNNKPEAVKTLLSYSPELEKATTTGETALMIAAKSQYFEITEMLIRAGAEIDFTDKYGATALHYAVLYGYPDITDLLIYYNALINHKTKEGTTPLITAAWTGNIEIADLLLQNGSDPDEKDDNGFTSFLLSAYYGDTAMMELFKSAGADIYLKTDKGYNAMALAVISGRNDAVEYLVGAGKNWDNSGIPGSDPYTIAAKYGRKDVINILKQNNIPGRVRYGVDQITFNLSAKATTHDFSTGASLIFREPLLKAGIVTGIDFKPWYTRVLVKESDTQFYQYMEKGSLAFAGIFKEFTLYEKPDRYNLIFSASLLGGYSFSNDLKGTFKSPDNSFRLIPAAALQIQSRHLTFSAGIEYMETGFHKNGPVWIRTGIGYNYYFDNLRARIKPPKWF